MEVDVPSLVKYVMREAYSEENEGLEMLGITVRFYRDLRTKLREEITKVKKLADAVSGEDGPLSETIRKKRFSSGPGPNGEVMHQEGDRVATKAAAMQYLEELEKQRETTNENAEQANLELQETLLKHQPKLRTMSDMSQKLQNVGQAAVQGGH